ncbi:MAG: iron-containing alcohol dehydrogenase [Rhodobiaceae bacterium]|jgi:maleylacetate reductase|nr:iron-containing alcohol dehydrogenase [Rhodobiaceae bacterium]MBT7280624.1 iron-containing alcohol dehydrogenase [Rhodobiaceae bacterium]
MTLTLDTSLDDEGIMGLPRTESIVHGANSAITHLPAVVAMAGIQRGFLLSTPSLEKNGHLAKVQTALGAAWCGSYAGSTAHNQMPSVLEAVAQVRAAKADGLIVLGGSSAVDMAKSVAMILAEGDDLEALRIRYSPEAGPTIPVLAQPKLPQIVIPTTLSGSEYTFAMAITDPALGEKLMFADAKLIPKAVFHDPVFCLDTPDRLWVGTGMKIFADCLEMLMSQKAKTMTNMYAREGLRVLFHNLPLSIDPKASQEQRLRARQNLHHGAYLAMSMAFNASLGLVAGIRHQVGAAYNVPHGEASTLALPHVMRWNRNVDSAEAALADAAQTLGLGGTSQAQQADAMIGAVERMMETMGLPKSLSAVGVPQTALQGIAEHVVGDMSVANNPRKINTAEDVMDVLNQAY